MKRLVIGLGMTLLVCGLCSAQTTRELALQALQATKPSVVRHDRSYHNLCFLQWASPLELPGTSLDQKIDHFITTYGEAFGMALPGTTFQTARNQVDPTNRSHVKMQQYHEGIIVFDGHLNFHFDQRGALQSLTAFILPDVAIATIPTLSDADARRRAKQWLNKTYGSADFTLSSQGLQIVQPSILLGRAATPRLAYVVVANNQQHIRDLLFVDAQSGAIITNYTANCQALHREQFLYQLDTPIWAEGNSFPGALDNWQQRQLETTKEVYDFFRLTFNHLSYDNADATFRLVDQANYIHECPNAMWNGQSTSYCPQLSTDDVVAHEWGHAYTEHTSNLLYAWQAGAINEAYSDIWGEVIDQLNGDNDLAPRTDCDNSQRWKIAEDAVALNGAIRDMYDPNCHGHPAKVSDELYHCTTDDYGGVHRNSGVINHSFALLVDGGTFNQKDIPAIGLTKAAHLFWHANYYYLSRTSDFAALADALVASIADLRNVDLPLLALHEAETGLSTEWIGTLDSIAVAHVIEATEMRLTPDFCDTYRVALQADAPDWCHAYEQGFLPFYSADFEVTPLDWTLSALEGSAEHWQERYWAHATNLPDGRAGKAMYAASPATGNCNTAPNHGLLRLESPSIPVSEELDGHIYLTFDHYFSLEKGYDGGNVRVQQNGGHWQNLPAHAFILNGYNTLLNMPQQSDNPLAGQRAFSGANAGSVAGSWGTSQINLSTIGVHPGDEIRIRWELGTDGCNGWDGWYVDNVMVGTCDEAAFLPVTWMEFTVYPKDNSNLLEWSTASEMNNAGFTIERSADGRIFDPVAWIPGAITTSTTQQYFFEDKDLPTTTTRLYYRLRQEDTDGSINYSPIRQVERKRTDAEWSVFPNPVSNQLQMRWHSSDQQTLQITVYNSKGQRVQATRSWETNTSIQSLDVSSWVSGIYSVHLSDEEGYRSVKRVVVR